MTSFILLSRKNIFIKENTRKILWTFYTQNNNLNIQEHYANKLGGE